MPISYFQGAMLGLLQGVSELFPVSSLGHSVILPKLFGWNIHQNDKYFLTFLVATHLATALVLLVFFWRDWVRILKGLGRSLRDRGIARTTPTRSSAGCSWSGRFRRACSACCCESKLRSVFASPQSAAIFLICNGILLYGAELLRRRAPVVEDDDDTRIARQVGWRRLFVGRRRRWRSSPASLAPGRRWAAVCSSASRTVTRRASRFCSRRRSSARPRC